MSHNIIEYNLGSSNIFFSKFIAKNYNSNWLLFEFKEEGSIYMNKL